MERGYVKLWRKVLDSKVLSDRNAWQLFGYLLAKTTYKPVDVEVRGINVTLNPGQCIFGRKKASQDLCRTEEEIRQAMYRLKKWQIATNKATKLFTIVTIVNWDIYQDTGYENNQENPQRNNQVTTKQQPSNNHVIRRTKKVKNKEDVSYDTLSGTNGTRLIPYQEIIDFLNTTCKTQFKSSTGTTRNLIKARCNQGFTLEDFKAVITTKAAQWMTDPKMVNYLRPQTLFGTKFEAYLTESNRKPIVKETLFQRKQREWEEKHGISSADQTVN